MSKSSKEKNDQVKQEQITIYVDDVAYQVEQDNNLLAAVLSQQLNLPYFCWHPSMGSVGACRQCAVTQYQDENDTRGRMVMSCMTPVNHGMRIGLRDKSSSKFREQVISAMMTNHPHDCPVCAEGGECHLQDMTVMTGHSKRNYQGQKRTFNNQYLGELVGHEMNRCITCYRCVRFYKDYAGGKDFGVYGSRNQVYFGRQTDGVLASEFAGNLVEVCPTGVFTNKLFSSHYTRKWDLQSAPSICSHCSVGCNTSIGERYGSVRRVMNRYNFDINSYFLCDRGRFGIGFVNAEQRIKQIKGITLKENEVVSELALAKKLAHHRQERFIGIGSARGSFEGNRFLKYLVGRENFSLGYSNNEMRLAVQHKQLLAQYPQESLHTVEQNDLVLIIAENIHQTAPRLALSVLQTLRNAGLDKASTIGVKYWQDSAVRTYAGDLLTPLFSLQSQSTQFDESAQQALILKPKQLVSCINDLCETLALDGNLTAENIELDVNTQPFLKELVAALKLAEKPLIITGLSSQDASLLAAVERLMACLASDKLALSPELVVVAPQCNSVGNLYLLNEQSLSMEQVIACLVNEQADSLILLEQDLEQLSLPQREQLRQHCKTLLVLDHSKSVVTELADMVMPVGVVSESGGHFVNYQGVLQAFYPAHAPVLPIMDNWRWLSLLAKILFVQNELYFTSLRQLHQYFADQGESWAVQIIQGQKDNKDQLVSSDKGIARQTHRASGRTSLMANQSVHEAKTTQTGTEKSKHDYLNFSMEGLSAGASDDMPYTWAPSWNSNQAILQHQQQINGELKHPHPANWLMFTFDDQLSELWSNDSTVVELENDTEQELVFVANIPWFLAERQARFNPEFVMMFSGNIIEISSELATENNWQAQQILSLDISGHICCAELKINDNLPKNLVNGAVFELPLVINNCAIKLHAATDAESVQHQQQQIARHQQAEQQKHAILKRLKQNDQHVPIRLMSGGLDDA